MAKDVNVCLIGTKFMGRAHSNAFLKVSRFFTDLPANPVMHTVVGRNAAESVSASEEVGAGGAGRGSRVGGRGSRGAGRRGSRVGGCGFRL